MHYNKQDTKTIIKKVIHFLKIQEEISSHEEEIQVWERIQAGIKKKDRIRHRKYIWSSVAMAASFAGILWIGAKYFFPHDDFYTIARQMAETSLESKEIQLIISKKDTIKIKTGTVITHEKMKSNMLEPEDEREKSPYNQLIVPQGKVGRLVLADGSRVHVNAGTKVIYPKHFGKKIREIFVDGEIYIDVTPNKKVPFIVRTNLFDVQVLGTSFDLKAYSSQMENNEVVLLRGLVNVSTRSGEEIQLFPDHKAIIQNDGYIRKENVDAEEYILWTQEILPLHDQTLQKVSQMLSRYYGATVICNETVKKIRISGKIDLKYGLEEALQYISVTSEISYKKEGNTYVLKKQ